MDEEIDRLVIGVRADTAGFARDVATLRGSLEDGLGGGAARAGRTIEAALEKAVRTGKLGFDDLRAVALKVMEQIASAAIKAGIDSIGGGGGLTGLAAKLIPSVLGLPGRATGGPVSPGAAYLVGERGPELFVPTASGSVAKLDGGDARGSRGLKVSIAIHAPNGDAPRALGRSGRQVARAVARALEQAED